MHEGDRNTSFFHASIQEWARVNEVRIYLLNVTWCEDNTQIGDMVVHHFSSLFSSPDPTCDENLFQDFIVSIGVQENNKLQQIRDEGEIWEAIKCLNQDSAPGPDGFTGWFFQGC